MASARIAKTLTLLNVQPTDPNHRFSAAQFERVEHALRDAQGDLADIIDALDHLDSGVVIYDKDDKLVLSNRRYREIYAGVTDLLVPGSSFTDISRAFYSRGLSQQMHLTEAQYVAKQLELHANPGDRDREYKLNSKTWLLISERKTAAGGLIGFRLDISERKEAERKLQISERRFRSLLEMSSDWYWEQDENFRFTMLSDGHLHRTGVDRLRRVGLTRWEIGVTGVTEQQWVDHRLALNNHESFRNFEYSWTDPKGRLLYLAISGDPIFDDNGQFTGYRGTGTDITERKRFEARIRELAEFDFLTGLPNRILLESHFDVAVRSASSRTANSIAGANTADQRGMALLFIDLDRFKNINDSLGHHVGDALLEQTAKRLLHAVGAQSTASRHGGDEFVVLVPDCGSIATVRVLAEKILSMLGAPYHLAGLELTVTPSIGISLCPADAEDLDALVRNADLAMYDAKARGRNQYSFFNAAMNEKAVQRLAIENGLRRAIERGEFYMVYQPIVRLHDSKVIGAEALIRWSNPELGVVHPAQFIPIAEETGLIVAIGDWVILEVCKQQQKWAEDALFTGFSVAVNVSAKQFSNRKIVAFLEKSLAACGLTPAAIELEITESVLMDDQDATAEVLSALTGAGFKLVIDDFGTGYSNLSYLKRFKIAKLKIDRSFVRDLITDADDAAITCGIISLAKNVGISLVAEGIENAKQRDFLLDHYCQQGQGFYLCVPMRAMELTAFLKDNAMSLPRERMAKRPAYPET